MDVSENKTRRGIRKKKSNRLLINQRRNNLISVHPQRPGTYWGPSYRQRIEPCAPHLRLRNQWHLGHSIDEMREFDIASHLFGLLCLKRRHKSSSTSASSCSLVKLEDLYFSCSSLDRSRSVHAPNSPATLTIRPIVLDIYFRTSFAARAMLSADERSRGSRDPCSLQ